MFQIEPAKLHKDPQSNYKRAFANLFRWDSPVRREKFRLRGRRRPPRPLVKLEEIERRDEDGNERKKKGVKKKRVAAFSTAAHRFSLAGDRNN